MKQRSKFYHPEAMAKAQLRERLDVRYDAVMKYLYFAEGAQSEECLRYLLEAFLEVKIERIERFPSGLFNRTASSQQMFVDGACRINGKDIVVIEMQKNYHENDFDRFSRYGCGLVQYRSDNGELYGAGKNLVLVFLGYPVPQRFRGYGSPYMFCRSDKGDEVSKLHMMQIETLSGLEGLLKEKVEELSRKDRFRLWLRYGHERAYSKKMEEIIEQEEGLKMAEQRLMKITSDKERFNAMMVQMNEELIRNEQIYAQTKLEKEQERRKHAEQEMEQERREKEQERMAKEQERKAKEQERKAKEQERRQRKQLEQQLLEMKVSLMVMSGASQEEVCKECNLTQESLQQIVNKVSKNEKT